MELFNYYKFILGRQIIVNDLAGGYWEILDYFDQIKKIFVDISKSIKIFRKRKIWRTIFNKHPYLKTVGQCHLSDWGDFDHALENA